VNVRGLAVSAFVLLSEVDASRRDKAAALWFPLNALAAHKAFSFDTGSVERSKSCGTTCQESEEFQLHVSARPR